MPAQPKKYTFENGVMKLNPEYSAWRAAQSGETAPSKVPANATPLAIVSSLEDVADATAQQKNGGVDMQIAATTVTALEVIQDDEYAKKLGQPDTLVDGSRILEGLTDFFVKFEVPVGMVNKLMALQLYHLKFIIDDSGSMNAKTDSMLNEASVHVLRGTTPDKRVPMTRWQEAETRLHNMIDVLAFIPTKSIEIRFLNAKNVIRLQRFGKSITEFAIDAHGQIVDNFSTVVVKYKTPTLRVLTEAFRSTAGSPDPCMHYLVTDGVPSDCNIQQVSQLITNRAQPDRNPLTLISCTDEDEEVEWMKEVEEVAPYCSELDDYQDEKNEVLNDQGVGFPYTKGYWLISQLVSAINPNDLDAIDENVPFTKDTLDNLLGRVHSSSEYQYYFERNPHASLYLDLYGRFLNEPTFARAFVSRQEQIRREKKAGYKNGARTKPPPAPATLAPQLANITSANQPFAVAQAQVYVP